MIMSIVCVQPRKPPDEERQFRHDAQLKDLSTLDRREEVSASCFYQPTLCRVWEPCHICSIC